MFDPDAHMPRINRGMVYLGAYLIADIRLALVPTGTAIEESVEVLCAHTTEHGKFLILGAFKG